MKKIVIIGAVIISVFMLIIFRSISPKADTGNKNMPSSRPQGGSRGAVAVQTVPVRYGSIQQRIDFTGTVSAAFTYVVAAKVSGRLLSLTKRIGDKVGRDEIVGHIDDTEHRQALDEAAAQVKVAKASLTEAQVQETHTARELQRIKQLVDKGISSQAELDGVQTLFASQQSRIALAQAQLAQREVVLAQAQTRLAYCTIRAARPGYIAVRHADGGALLSANTPVLTVIGIDTVYVEIAVSEREYPKIRKGQKATVGVDAIPQRNFTGTITHTAPQFQTATRTATVEIAMKNDSLLLKPGMFARITIILDQRDSTQLVPAAAVVNRNQTNAVFVVDASGTAKLVPVVVGITDKDNVQILSPALQGAVVTIGHHLLADGTMVTTTRNGNDSGKRGNGAPSDDPRKGAGKKTS